MAKKNASPKIVSRPGGRTGSTNPSLKPVTNPTKYKGGKNTPLKVCPKK